jgi:hypothetical protein
MYFSAKLYTWKKYDPGQSCGQTTDAMDGLLLLLTGVVMLTPWVVSSFLSLRRDRHPTRPQDVQAGDILLQRPLHQLHFCVEHGTWPGWAVLVQSVFAALVWPILRSHATHALQCIEVQGGGGRGTRQWGHLVFVHTQYGQVRKMTGKGFPPGYLETCVVVPTRDRWNAVAGGGDRIRHVMEGLVGRRLNPMWLLLTPVIRKTGRWSTIYPLHHKRFRIHNCTHLIALCWLEVGVRLVEFKTGLSIQGLYPDDFRIDDKVKTLVREGEEEEKKKNETALSPRILYRDNVIHPSNVAGITGESTDEEEEEM